MKFIYKTISAAVVGFALKKGIDAIENGTANKSIIDRFGRPLRDAHLGFNNTAYVLGLISEKKKAEWNKNVVEKYNAVHTFPESNPIPNGNSGNQGDISASYLEGEEHTKPKAKQNRMPTKNI